MLDIAKFFDSWTFTHKEQGTPSAPPAVQKPITSVKPNSMEDALSPFISSGESPVRPGHVCELSIINEVEEVSVVLTTNDKKRNESPSLRGGNVIEKVLSAFDGEIVGFTGALKDLYEERAAIMEFDGGLTKRQAEAEAANII